MTDPQTNITTSQANYYWGVSVRQYLRSVKRLWNDSALESGGHAAVDNVRHYWEQVPLGQTVLVPPDSDQYEFSLVEYSDEYDSQQLKRQIGLPAKADLPEPYKKTFRGLSSILDTNRVSHVWLVKTSTRGPPPEHETVRVEAVEPVPKHILENAVEATDNFLQSAGIGLDIAAEDYMADGEPGL